MNTRNTILHGGTPIFRAGLAIMVDQLDEVVDGMNIPFSATQELIIFTLPAISSVASGRALQKVLKNRQPEAIVIVIGPRPKPVALRRLLQKGLSSYLLYTATAKTIAKAIAAANRKEIFIDPSISSAFLNAQLGLRSATEMVLTRREKEVLQLIVEENTTDEIARKLFISSCTVETHRANILGKLGVRNVAGIVREAMRRNLCEVS